MSDIAKCKDNKCPSKLICYRFTAPASEFWQSYGVFNREEDADNCDMFWKTKQQNIKEFKKTKKILFIAILLLSSFNYAQEKSFAIKYNYSILENETKFKKIDLTIVFWQKKS